MRTSAFVFAIIGAVFGAILGLVAMAVGGAATELDVEGGDQTIGLGLSAIAAAGFAVLCAGLYYGGKHRTLMAWGLLIAAVWHLVSISAFGIPGFLFILLASFFAWLGRKERRQIDARTPQGVTSD